MTILRFEIAARAAARVETIGYPDLDKPKGRARADAYVEANWRPIWESMTAARDA